MAFYRVIAFAVTAGRSTSLESIVLCICVHKNNRFQKNIMMQNMNILIFALPVVYRPSAAHVAFITIIKVFIVLRYIHYTFCTSISKRIQTGLKRNLPFSVNRLYAFSPEMKACHGQVVEGPSSY